MTFDSLLVHTVTIQTAGSTTDAYGDAEKDWTDPTEVSTPARVVQRVANEVLGNREASVTEWVVFLPPDVSVTHGDRVVWDALTFEVSGDPEPAYRRTAAMHHQEVPINKIEG